MGFGNLLSQSAGWYQRRLNVGPDGGVFNRNTVTTRMDIGLCGGRIRNMFRNTTVTRSLQTAIIVLADGHKGVAIAEVMLLVLGKKVDTMWGRAWTWRLRAL